MYYIIEDTLKECCKKDIMKNEKQFVAILTQKEWSTNRDIFDMGIDIEPDTAEIHSTKAEVNYDSLTGTFSVPDRSDITGEDKKFAFALDEKGIVFIDDSEEADKIIAVIKKSKKWRMPSLERFLYDFLNCIIKDDLMIIEGYERELDDMENAILNQGIDTVSNRVNEIRDDIRDLKTHYEQLDDLAEVLEDNENNFFKKENLRYFRMFLNRLDRFRDLSSSLRDYTMQIHDLYKAQLEIKQNRIMTVLTVVTTIFTPITVLTGWYGMNFRYMPELDMRYAYPAMVIISGVVVISGLIYFKIKKWL